MRPILKDGVAWSVGRSVTVMSPAKTAEPIDMSFGLWSLVGQRNHVGLFGGVQVLTREAAILTGVWPIEEHCKTEFYGVW